ncbi:pyrroloquinoline quinone biosynthesis protein PqqE [Gilvimarinus sp. F26214L]|uniref:pyrroloquinoline quinone biosynthesis protein PqqE n=1 Tax=Gilvimarinus sp. DZF01 TaxID=3461371 RepID=UPI0040452701
MSSAQFSDHSSLPIPMWLLAELTYACPLQCPYCSNPLQLPSSRKEELSTEQWLDVMRQARALGAVQLGFSGGEPLVRPDLEHLIREANDMGFYCNLITSAIGLDEAKIRAFKEAGLRHIQISFQGSDAESNARFGGTDSFEHKLSMAKKVAEHKLPLGLNFVLHRQNIHQVEPFLEQALALGAEFVELANSQYYGWALHNREQLLPSRQQIEEAERVTNEFRARHPNEMDVFFVAPDYYDDRPKKCSNGWGTTFITVNPKGEVLPCQSAHVIPGLAIPSVKTSSLAEIWRDSELFNRFRGTEWMREPCRSCPEREIDLGGCRCQAFLLTGDAANADPVCSLSPQHHVITDAVAAAQQEGNGIQPLVFRNPRNGKKLLEES